MKQASRFRLLKPPTLGLLGAMMVSAEWPRVNTLADTPMTWNNGADPCRLLTGSAVL